MWGTVVLVVTVLVILAFKGNNRPVGLPPGPFALPFFGNVLSILLSSPKAVFKKFVENYGGILSYKVFGKWTVLVSDPALMRSALGDSATSGRIDLLLFEDRNAIIRGREGPCLGIVGASNEVWKTQRRFTLRTLKDLGFGRNAIEPIIQEEWEEMMQLLLNRHGEKMDVGFLCNRSTINVLWAITIGKRYSYDDKKLEDLVGKVSRMMQTFNPFHPALRFRWVRKLFPNLSIIRTTIGSMKELLTFIENEIELYKEQKAGQVDMGCYIGAYLYEMEQLKPEEVDDASLSMEHLKAIILELFIAGSETTASTLRWAVYYLATHPKVQRAVQEELDRVVGRDNTPSLMHMDRLPYTMATIYEVQRVADLFPVGIPHRTIEDTSIGGYHIPKGTALSFNLSHGLSHPKYWKDPNKFLPEHFLTDDGKLFKPDHFLPFGLGKRVCLGESLARLEIFTFLSGLMHHFSWKLSDDSIGWMTSTITNRPPDFLVHATSRKEAE